MAKAQAEAGSIRPNELGIPAIRNYSPEEYGENPMNWGIVSDHRGIIYIANLNGVLEFDGVSWRAIKTPKESWVLSIAVNSEGTVFAGAFGDFGYLAPDSLGNSQFISLVEHLDPADREFTEVWRIHCTGRGTFFRTRSKLYFWANNEFKILRTESSFSLSSVVNDTLYIEEYGKGIMKTAGDSLIRIPGSERLSPLGLVATVPYDSHHKLFCSNQKGLLLFNGKTISPFTSPVNAFIRENGLSSAVALPGNKFAIGTYRRGACIIDKTGTVLQVLDISSGLRNEDIKQLYCDSQGMLWMALNSGIARVQAHDPATFFTERQGLKGNVVSIARHKGILYAATSQSIYYLDTDLSNRNAAAKKSGMYTPVFKPVNGNKSQGFWLLPVGETLLATTGGGSGIYQIEGTQAHPVNPASTEREGAYVLHRSKIDKNIIYAGLKNGMEVLKLTGQRWVSTGRVDGIHEEIRTIVEGKDGVLWLGTVFQGVLRVRLTTQNSNGWQAEVERFNRAHGLPDGPANISRINGNIVFATRKGHRRFDAAQKRFYPDSTITPELADTTLIAAWVEEDQFGQVFVWPVNEDGKSELWLASPQRDTGYLVDKQRFRAITSFGGFHTTFTDYDSVIWVGSNNGLVRYDPRVSKQFTAGYLTQIRRVATIKGDSLIFGGASFPEQAPPAFPYKNRALRFEYSLPFFEEVSQNRYQYFLDGFDDNWSGWTGETKKDYTNMPPGEYQFKVRAKNVYRQLSAEAAYSFSILPPWYRSIWMMLLYVLFSGAAIYGLVKFRVRKLEQKSQELETLVAERTVKIVEQRNQLKAQSEKLQEMDALKSRFFANISHEFRTPLTLILGLVRKFKENREILPALQDYDIIHRNANRLLQLINQLLDLTKLESGNVKLQAAKGDIVQFLRRISASFVSMGERKQIQMTFNGAPIGAEGGHSEIQLYFDTDKLEKVFYNLLSNAFKFTPPQGKIGVEISIGNDSEHTGENMISIQVFNSGPGILPEKLPYIFDRFYQADSSSTREFEGSGIGLALTKELVELHHGIINVKSVPGEKTTFTVQLPMGRAHLSAEEIVEDADAGEIRLLEPEAVELLLNPQPGQRSVAQPEPGAEKTMVLIVEDHPDLRAFIGNHLTEEYHVETAENGAIGLEKAEALIPDLVISDIMMPEMDGYQLCEALKNNDKTNHIPIILLTAKAARQDKMEGLETGADDYLVKPFDPEELQVRVRNLIKIRQQMREKFGAEMLLKPKDVSVPSSQKVFLERLTSIIEEHMDDENFNVESLGEELGMSRAQIHRKLKAISNQSATEFIRNFRLQRGAELLLKDAGNIAEIAYMVGFNSQAYFTRSFQEAFGCSPSEYKKRNDLK